MHPTKTTRRTNYGWLLLENNRSESSLGSLGRRRIGEFKGPNGYSISIYEKRWQEDYKPTAADVAEIAAPAFIS